MMEMLMVTLIMAMRGINSRGPQAGQGVFWVSDAPSRVIGPQKKPGAKRHYMVSGTLAPLYTVFGLKLGCSGATAPIGDEVL